ncbi:hypothetical protein FB45DRAFT_483753 [Roridomyces roridus]|uniref:Uncharacterized protein n=1 Tax=Roridomyces roridus TaxID=1738132 RepID=A0AAD7C0F2_9AGAR|nr:hypothetical protein FB45DRAFT_483753 [Roridomyces roridus]
MIGLVQERGPCRITTAHNPSRSTHTRGTMRNMMYIHQPVGIGFPHGTLSVGASCIGRTELLADLPSRLPLLASCAERSGALDRVIRRALRTLLRPTIAP